MAQTRAWTPPELAGVVTASIGVVVLLGWILDLAPLTQVFPDLPAMSPSTALVHVLAGGALWLTQSTHAEAGARRIGRLCAAAVALLALALLAAQLSGWHETVDGVLVQAAGGGDRTGDAASRMSPTTWLNFAALALAILLRDRNRRRADVAAQLLSIAAVLTSLLAIVSFAYEIPSFGAYVPMSAHAAMAFLILALGVLAVRPTDGLTAPLVAGGVSGDAARRLLPAAVVLPVVLGFLELTAHRAGIVDPDTGVAVLVVSTVFMLGVLVWWNARLIHAAERRRLEAERQLVHNAFHDGLTGLANRALFTDRLGHALALGRRYEAQRFAVLFVDLDRFKIVNDSLGHPVGDQLLVEVARRIQACRIATDTVARLGGDEFAVLLENIRDARDAIRVAERIQQRLAAPITIDEHEVFASASIGIVLDIAGYLHPEDVLRDAHTAMYRAKALGKDRYEVFDVPMRAVAVERLRLETDLRHTVEEGGLSVHYQPIVSLADGAISGFEALVRWRHPERGLVTPEEFVPLAEETGLIAPITWQVMRTACHQLREWQSRALHTPALTMSVNLSAVPLAQPDFLSQMARVLEETGIDPESLRIELTESVLMGPTTYTAEKLARLRAMRIQVQIDDFGTGYSSFGYLQRFAIDALKVDRSFIEGLGRSEEAEQIVRTIVTLAHTMGMSVTAEGVETPEQAARLRAIGCSHAQGYLFSRALASDEAERLLTGPAPWQAALDGARLLLVS